MKHDCWPWNVQIRCPHCGMRTQPEWGEARYQIVDDAETGRYVGFDCPNCGRHILDWESQHRAMPPQEPATVLPPWFWVAWAAIVLLYLYWLAVGGAR